MKLAILDAHALNPGDLSWEPFYKFFDEVKVYENTEACDVLERIKGFEAILINKVVITDEILEKNPGLKYIGVLATGYNVVDVESCKKRGVAVTNIPQYSTDAVAQHVFAFILNFTNHVSLHDESVKKGEWEKAESFCYWKSPLTELAGKTFGILGYGSIGKKSAEIAKAFGMNVIVCSRTKKEGVENVSLEDLFKRSDFLTLHTPLTEQTKEIINKNTLSIINPDCVLINTARGGLVNENDLCEALNNGKLKGYCGDVVAVEPMKSNCPLLKAKNCVLTPHIAWAPLETRIRLEKIAVENVKAWIEGKILNRV